MKRILCLLITSALLLTTFAGCSSGDTNSNNSTGTKGNTSSESNTSESETEAETEPDYLAHLAGKSFGDIEFRVLANGAGAGEWEGHEIEAEELTGDLINDAVYERNAIIRDNYGVNIVSVKSTGICTDDFRQAVKASSNDYDMGLVYANGAIPLSLEGGLYDLKALPNVQLDAAYFDQNSNETLTLENHLYVSYGDMNMQNIDLAWCVMFNKQIAADNALPNMYEIVEKGEWNFDTLATLSKNNLRDLDGDGKITESDSLGLVTPYDRTCLAFMFGSDIEFIDKDANDSPVYNSLGDKVYSVYDKVLALYNDDSCMNVYNITNSWRGSENMFMENRILFYVECMQNLSRFRDMEVDFGVLPMPKYDKAQEKYRSMVCDFASATVIPSYCQNTELAGFVLDALNATSHNTVRYAYVEKALKYKNSRDEESLTSINIILDSMYYDPTYLYGWGGLTTTIGSLATAQSDSLASSLKRLDKKMQSTITKYLERYHEILAAN